MPRRLLLLLLILWLPIQASALPVLALACDAEHGHMHSHAAGTLAQGDQHGDESGSAGHHNDGAGTNVHYCCHHFSAVPFTPVPTSNDGARAPAAEPARPLVSIFPERQVRPPRA